MTRKKQLPELGSFEIAPTDGLGHGLNVQLVFYDWDFNGGQLTYHVDI